MDQVALSRKEVPTRVADHARPCLARHRLDPRFSAGGFYGPGTPALRAPSLASRASAAVWPSPRF